MFPQQTGLLNMLYSDFKKNVSWANVELIIRAFMQHFLYAMMVAGVYQGGTPEHAFYEQLHVFFTWCLRWLLFLFSDEQCMYCKALVILISVSSFYSAYIVHFCCFLCTVHADKSGPDLTAPLLTAGSVEVSVSEKFVLALTGNSSSMP